MITVKDLAAKLSAYALQYPNDEIMLAYDSDVAYPFGRGDTNQAMGSIGFERFLVLVPDFKGGKKLHLKGRE